MICLTYCPPFATENNYGVCHCDTGYVELSYRPLICGIVCPSNTVNNGSGRCICNNQSGEALYSFLKSQVTNVCNSECVDTHAYYYTEDL